MWRPEEWIKGKDASISYSQETTLNIKVEIDDRAKAERSKQHWHDYINQKKGIPDKKDFRARKIAGIKKSTTLSQRIQFPKK